jgi:hypothetical protein
MTPKWLQNLRKKRKIKEQEKLIEALRRPEKETRRRPAAKFASNRTRNTGPG